MVDRLAYRRGVPVNAVSSTPHVANHVAGSLYHLKSYAVSPGDLLVQAAAYDGVGAFQARNVARTASRRGPLELELQFVGAALAFVLDVGHRVGRDLQPLARDLNIIENGRPVSSAAARRRSFATNWRFE